MDWTGCTVTSCIRTIEGTVNPGQFTIANIIERTCRYAKDNSCKYSRKYIPVIDKEGNPVNYHSKKHTEK